jgi:hypothetical protein
MRLLKDGCVWHSPEFGESLVTLVTVDPNATFSPVIAPGRHGYGLDLNINYTDSPSMRCRFSSGGGHVTDGIGLPSSLTSAHSINVRHVFGNSSSPRMGIMVTF